MKSNLRQMMWVVGGLFVVMFAVVSPSFADEFKVEKVPEAAAVAAPSPATPTPISVSSTPSPKFKINLPMTLSALPLQYTFVKGDSDKFQAQQWMKRGYVGGVEDFTMEYKDEKEKITVSAEGHAIIGNNDYAGDFELTKEDFGFLKFDYKEFRKYYDGRGGVTAFSRFSGSDVDRDLFLDIGKFGIETGLTMEDLPEMSVFYEHEYRKGSKSRLAWANAVDGGAVRYIAPGWQEIDESVNAFGLRAKKEIKGYTLRGEQSWEFVDIQTKRFAYQVANTATASDYKRRFQILEPESNVASTNLSADKWFLDEKIYSSTAYRFSHLRNHERDNYQEMTSSMVPRCYSNAECKRDATADNVMDTHSFGLNGMFFPAKDLSLDTRLKAELVNRGGTSTYFTDEAGVALGTAPDGVPVRREENVTTASKKKLAESASLRYKGIPWTALYSDFEFEQIQDRLQEERVSRGTTPSATENYFRETYGNNFRGDWTLGGDFSPWTFMNMTNQVKYGRSNTDYDNETKTGPDSTAFFDEVNIEKVSYTSRLTLRPTYWMSTSLRYVLADNNYRTRTRFDAGKYIRSNSLSTSYTADVTVMPRTDLYLTGSITKQGTTTRSPWGDYTGQNFVPAFSSDSYTWMLSADYKPSTKWGIDANMFMTTADNFKDSAYAQTYGAEFDRIGLTTNFNYMVNDKLTAKPYYGYYHYGEFGGYGDYDAHMIGLNLVTTWG